ncbi:Tyrosine-protein phosphatase non-receptor type 2 [Larimichthys crocea]|uniref:Tyrosine-protein phosphatase non-receptor type n=2 Tax=Larimichthys crocea TaxID=215358 RepID=A0A6G0IB25_LARCR|nr:tyrosine-protein phosphatase non-receptor type 2 isoform X1 [Larimichthys crocea]KAE8288396.1 Tyrosine-protein phosphatase non-receptor type 2 [Larimichthys crocea]TMS11100.1 Tyrosine-protein phosphatase non-receptor type 2 [Larimichthys crocea]
MEQEFEDIDSSGRWQNLYNEIRNQASEYPYRVAKLPVNRNLNRYRDVSPYDHSRVKLENSENDYINASLVMVEEAQRAYILSQGPLRNTCGHFWLMIWEQCSKAVIMLNRVIEKGSEKCAQYWPTTEELQMSFTDTGFVVRLLSEEDQSYYTIRVLELQNTMTGESRDIYHFHYTTWPDFGVPESPASFLNFLFKVRESGSLGPEHGPSVVHCSAGIGRSGTFALVDTCLVLMDRRKNPSSVDVQKVLLDMREYRMGLIQTPDQLRFSYMAVIEGAKLILTDNSAAQQIKQRVISKEEKEPDLPPPPPPPRPHLNDSKPNGQPGPCLEPEDASGDHAPEEEPESQDHNMEENSGHVRKRHREERIASTSQKVQQMKQRLTDSERKREKWLYWRPILLNVGAGAALAAGLLVYWMYS